MYNKAIHQLLNNKAAYYNQRSFIPPDPISIPHQYTLLQDVEIAALFAALFAWGNRTTIINKTTELLKLMDNAPYQFVTQHQSKHLKHFSGFKHRTFMYDDVLYFIYFLQHHYAKHASLETAFFTPDITTVEAALNHFKTYFFSLPHLARTHKHIASPAQHSACKRLCMYLRWLVRTDASGVDFGLWKSIAPSQLIIPLDVHVGNIARQLGLLPANSTNNWQAAVGLTNTLKLYNAQDPVLYDFALFSMGVLES